MTARNDITGDLIKTRATMGKEFEDNWNRIFGKKDKVAEPAATTDKPVEPVQLDLFDEERADVIGANGNDGLHYTE